MGIMGIVLALTDIPLWLRDLTWPFYGFLLLVVCPFGREELRLDGFLGFETRMVGLHKLKVSMIGGGRCGPGRIL
jgi:hypothetical protein